MKKRVVPAWVLVAGLLAGAPGSAAWADDPARLSVGIAPAYWYPSPLDANAAYYRPSGGGALSFGLSFPFLPWLSLTAGLGYDYAKLGSVWSTSQVTAGGGIRTGFPLLSWLSLALGAEAGYYFYFPNEIGISSGFGGLSVTGTIGVDLTLFSPWRIEAGAAYRYLGGLYQGIGVRVGASYVIPLGAPSATHVPPPEQKPAPLAALAEQPSNTRTGAFQIVEVSLQGAFPILHAYYDDHPIGALKVRNGSAAPVTDVTATVMIRQFMDAPKPCKGPGELPPGAEATIDLLALFNKGILDVTEATKVAAEITVGWKSAGKAETTTRVETLRVYDRNAMTWDDDRKAAAFVTAKEPVVLAFSNNVNAMLAKNLFRGVEKNLQLAAGIHDALRLSDVSYVSNPLTPYAVTSQNKSTVDTLKFPRQTLEYRSGDCSDLSILYCALLESLQIETAFITVPGHIFMAFALSSPEAEIRKSLTQTDELIFRDGRVWVPIEVTERKGAFLDAWQAGAKEWREYGAKGLTGFFPIREAWRLYEPVGLTGQGTAFGLPEASRIVADFKADVQRFVEREIFPKAAAIQAQISRQFDPKTVNSLGALYARYGLMEKARTEFLKVAEKYEYVPAMVNLGNIEYLKPDMEAALTWYNKAYARAPADPQVLLSVARASHELEDYRTARNAYTALKGIDPDLADRFSYLELKGDEAKRAASILGNSEEVIWEE